MRRKQLIFIGITWLVVAMLIFWATRRSFAQETLEENEKFERGQMAGILYAETNGEQGVHRVFLPLKRTNVDLVVIAGVVKANVTQVFVNDTEFPLEAVYVFPLPAKAAVTDMVFKVDHRIVRSVIKERQNAKKIYEKAKAAGKKAALLEQERPNIFTTSVANFLPGETVEITLSYMEAVDYKKGIYTVNFPMVVGQRYIPCPRTESSKREVEDAGRLNPPLLHPNLDSGHRLKLTAKIEGIPVEKITSTTHKLDVTGNGSSFNVRLADELTVPDCDLNMKIALKKDAAPLISYIESSIGEDRNDIGGYDTPTPINSPSNDSTPVDNVSKEMEKNAILRNEIKKKIGNSTYGMLTVFPPLAGAPSAFEIPRDVVFLIDTSGSMSGMSIGQAKAGLRRCMKMLRPKDRFTIVRFSSDYSYFNPGLLTADTGILREAENYIDYLHADGGTEMQQALRYVLDVHQRSSSTSDRIKMIVFLTDGAVGNEDTLIQLLGERLGKCRLFTFGIGSAPNEYLMRKMAEIGRGQSRFIHSNEDVGDVMADFFKTLDSAVMTDISLVLKDTLGNIIPDVEYYPNPCPDVFFERPLQVFIRKPLDREGKIHLAGKLAGVPVEYECRLGKGYGFDEKNGTGNVGVQFDAVDRMFGKRKIDELMFRRIRSQSYVEREELRNEIIGVSLGHQVMSKFTARVAVEERVTKKPDGTMKKVNVPVPLPKGWNPTKFHATATDNVLMLLLGLVTLLAGLMVFVLRRFLSR